MSEESFIEVLEMQEKNGVITCWRPAKSDTNLLDLRLKLLATSLRETLPERDPFKLLPDNWFSLILALFEGNWDALSGTDLDATLRAWQRKINAFFPEGIPSQEKNKLKHLILNFDPVTEAATHVEIQRIRNQRP